MNIDVTTTLRSGKVETHRMTLFLEYCVDENEEFEAAMFRLDPNHDRWAANQGCSIQPLNHKSLCAA